MRLRGRHLVPAAACSIAVCVAATAHAADDMRVAEVGTWTREPQPSQAPPGGVAIGNLPDGPSTVAAVRFTGERDRRTITLRLKQSGGTAPIGAAIRACVTTGPWKSVENGDLATAPRASCDAGEVAFAADADGAWTADVTALLAVSSSVVLLPGVQAPPLFSLTFERPAAHLGALPPASDASEPDGAAAPAQAEFQPADPLEGLPGPASITAANTEEALPPLPAVTAPVPAPGGAPSVSANPLPTTGPAAGTALQAPDDGHGRDYAQALRLVLLAVLAGGASFAWSRADVRGRLATLGPLARWRRSSAGGPG